MTGQQRCLKQLHVATGNLPVAFTRPHWHHLVSQRDYKTSWTKTVSHLFAGRGKGLNRRTWLKLIREHHKCLAVTLMASFFEEKKQNKHELWFVQIWSYWRQIVIQGQNTFRLSYPKHARKRLPHFREGGGEEREFYESVNKISLQKNVIISFPFLACGECSRCSCSCVDSAYVFGCVGTMYCSQSLSPFCMWDNQPTHTHTHTHINKRHSSVHRRFVHKVQRTHTNHYCLK